MKKQNEVKRINFNVPYFDAGGVRYHMNKTLSVERWRAFEDLQPLLMLGRTSQDIYNQTVKAYEKLQEPKIADASVLLHNLILGLKDHLEKRYHPALMITALFFNAEDEDKKTFDDDLMKAKIESWQQEGYAMEDFFTVAFNLVPGFMKIYEDDLQNISNQIKKAEKEVSKDKK